MPVLLVSNWYESHYEGSDQVTWPTPILITVQLLHLEPQRARQSSSLGYVLMKYFTILGPNISIHLQVCPSSKIQNQSTLFVNWLSSSFIFLCPFWEYFDNESWMMESQLTFFINHLSSSIKFFANPETERGRDE